MKKIVFLDYDGVVNRKMWAKDNDKWVCRYGYPEDGAVNDAQAVQWVSEFCEKYGYDIVVTSTWRKYPEWKLCLKNAGLRKSVKILGATALPAKSRSDEITDYLASHPDVDAYLVFDDNAELVGGAHDERLVLCDKACGFGENEYNRAVAAHLGNERKTASTLTSTTPSYTRDTAEDALHILYERGELSTSILQRNLRIGFARANEIINDLLDAKIVSALKEKGETKYKPLIEYEEARKRLK
jgi:hypothetical protein